MKTLIACGFLFVLGIGYAIYHDYSYHSRLLADCMKDKKEYECYAMLKTDQQVIPIFIPSGR